MGNVLLFPKVERTYRNISYFELANIFNLEEYSGGVHRGLHDYSKHYHPEIDLQDVIKISNQLWNFIRPSTVTINGQSLKLQWTHNQDFLELTVWTRIRWIVQLDGETFNGLIPIDY